MFTFSVIAILFSVLSSLLVVLTLADPKNIKNKEKKQVRELTLKKNYFIGKIKHTQIKLNHDPTSYELKNQLIDLQNSLSSIEFELKTKKDTL